MFAAARGLHELLYEQNRSEVVGSELLDALLTRVHFDGATGFVNFFDASANPDATYKGDRRAGVSYALVNFVDSNVNFVTVGSWTPCSVGGCSWSERWQQSTAPTYSTEWAPPSSHRKRVQSSSLAARLTPAHRRPVRHCGPSLTCPFGSRPHWDPIPAWIPPVAGTTAHLCKSRSRG